MPTDVATRCATVAIIGKPNAGKSTLLNALIGEKLAITSPRPQSTRQPVVGVLTEAETQLIFLDQAGLLSPDYPLQQAMLDLAVESIRQADMVLYLHPAVAGDPPSLGALVPQLANIPQPIATLLTKTDLVAHGDPLGSSCPAPSIPVSAVAREGLEAVLEWCREHAPVRPFRHDSEELSTQPLRFFAGELVREAAFEVLQQELPYAVATEVDEFREGTEPVYIRMAVFVERASQKRMVIGKHGGTVKALGATARGKIEKLLGRPVYLDLWVKVLPKWRSRAHALARLGFPARR